MKSRAELKRENKRLKRELAELRATIAVSLWSISEPIPKEDVWITTEGILP